MTVVEYSPDPDVRLIRNSWARKGVLERVRGVKFMWGLFACNELLHRRFGRLDSAPCSYCSGADETLWHVIGQCNDADAVALLAQTGPIGCGMYCRRRSRCRKGGRRYVRTWRMLYGDYGRWVEMGGSPAWAPGTTGPHSETA
jgi:hypothetical protein